LVKKGSYLPVGSRIPIWSAFRKSLAKPIRHLLYLQRNDAMITITQPSSHAVCHASNHLCRHTELVRPAVVLMQHDVWKCKTQALHKSVWTEDQNDD
jgi:hypothetical protein